MSGHEISGAEEPKGRNQPADGEDDFRGFDGLARALNHDDPGIVLSAETAVEAIKNYHIDVRKIQPLSPDDTSFGPHPSLRVPDVTVETLFADAAWHERQAQQLQDFTEALGGDEGIRDMLRHWFGKTD